MPGILALAHPASSILSDPHGGAPAARGGTAEAQGLGLRLGCWAWGLDLNPKA